MGSPPKAYQYYKSHLCRGQRSLKRPNFPCEPQMHMQPSLLQHGHLGDYLSRLALSVHLRPLRYHSSREEGRYSSREEGCYSSRNNTRAFCSTLGPWVIWLTRPGAGEGALAAGLLGIRANVEGFRRGLALNSTRLII
jgi:hypothetical protein